MRTLLSWLGLLGAAFLAEQAIAAQPPNVLFIIADDLRDELGCYGHSHIRSPHLDSLAARGTVFTRAYCQYALCGPSRASLFTGRYPVNTGVFSNRVHFRDRHPDIVSLPQHFKRQGYRTQAIGKLLHDTKTDEVSWTEGYFFDPHHVYASRRDRDGKALIDGHHPENKLVPLFESPDVDDSAYRDGRYTDRAVKAISEFAESERPFFLMVGFHKPHTPFNAPRRYWDLYDREAIPLATNQYPPVGSPPFAVAGARYVRSFRDIPDEGRFDDRLQREIKHAYYACISYIDAQVGRLIASLQRHGLDESTIVVFTSDHGYQLGEHDLWCKHTNFETSTKVPLIVADPRQRTRGASTSARVELIDLTPTLAERCGLPPLIGSDGESFAELLDRPGSRDSQATSALSRYHRAGRIGLSLRSERYRYTEWRDGKTGEHVATELFDHHVDSQENRNLAGQGVVPDDVERAHADWLRQSVGAN